MVKRANKQTDDPTNRTPDEWAAIVAELKKDLAASEARHRLNESGNPEEWVACKIAAGVVDMPYTTLQKLAQGGIVDSIKVGGWRLVNLPSARAWKQRFTRRR
jgi:hypothetical protein